jgi:hypothetical protein
MRHVLELANQLLEKKSKTMTLGNTLLFAGKHNDDQYYIIETSRDLTICLPIFRFVTSTKIAEKMIQLENAQLSNAPSGWCPSNIQIYDIISLERIKRLI